MRVIAGSRRSIRLTTVKGDKVRPTTDRIKETLFNILQPDIPGASFLDLFSGSGAIGIEALSRGAKDAVLVEQDRDALACIHANLKATRFEAEAQVKAGDVLSVLRTLQHVPFDLISRLMVAVDNNKLYTRSRNTDKEIEKILNQGWLHYETIREELKNEIDEN